MSKTKGLLLAVAAAAMAFTLSCSDDKDDGGGGVIGGGGGNSGLNGTWYDSDGNKMILNNGSFTQSDSKDADVAKGTYNASGSNMTMTLTQIHGALFEEMDGFTNKWYNQSEFRTAFYDAMAEIGGGVLPQSMLNKLVDETVSAMFAPQTATYSLSANTLTIDWEVDMNTSYGHSFHSAGTDVYTQTPGGGGGGGGNSGSWPPENVRNEYSIGGLNPPPNCNIHTYSTINLGMVNTLNIYFTPTNTNDTKAYFNNWFTSNGWTVGAETAAVIQWMKGSQALTAMYTYNDDDGMGALAVMRMGN